MKKKIRVLVSFCLMVTISQLVFAQNLLWSKKINQPKVCTEKGLMIDKNGITYSYGSRGIDPNQNPTLPFLTDTAGSFLQAYSTNGSLLFSKRWTIPFYIQKMDYDGNQYFYFSGLFLGTQIIDGITLISHGKADGVTGKMDLTGHVIWMNTFGGPGADMGNGVCFSSTNNSVYATGNIRDTLFLNASLQSVNQQSAIVVHYSSTGALINHKLYDFISKRDLGYINSGREICKGPSENIFLLLDRDGHNWNGPDSVPFPIMGRYIIKLNSTLDTLWSTYIIGPASYYGWSCNSLRVAANGDAYIAWKSSGKYGGDAYLSRLNGNTGQINWSYYNKDGAYINLFIDVNTVFLIGNEGANGCPCPNNNEGYYVVKKIDQNNILLGETRLAGVYLNAITKDLSGNLFITGNFWEGPVIMGPDTLIANNPPDSQQFLTKLSDINCTAPVISVSVPDIYGHYYLLCAGDQATLTVNLTQGTFKWSNGANGTQTNVNSTGLYYLINSQPNGCKAYSLPVDIRVNDNTVTQTGNILTANMSGANYQWIDCVNNNALIPGATKQNFTPVNSGDYAVIIKYNNCTDTSACINVVISGIAGNATTSILSVFPNPTDNITCINYKNDEISGSFQLEIKNILGQSIYTSTISSFQGEYKNTIDLSKWRPGDYFIHIITERETIVKKIVLY